jgi:hypothetical protein
VTQYSFSFTLLRSFVWMSLYAFETRFSAHRSSGSHSFAAMPMLHLILHTKDDAGLSPDTSDTNVASSTYCLSAYLATHCALVLAILCPQSPLLSCILFTYTNTENIITRYTLRNAKSMLNTLQLTPKEQAIFLHPFESPHRNWLPVVVEENSGGYPQASPGSRDS